MKKLLLPLVVCSCLVSSCETTTPQQYFDRAVLNGNLMHGFAGSGMERQLKEPSVKLVDPAGSEFVAMKRKEVIDNKLLSIEDAYVKVKKLKETEDTRELLQASRALYEYVLPVYRNEYRELARLYDEGAPANEIEALGHSIEEKYRAGFESRMGALRAVGEPFAARHGIQVRWDVGTSPR